MLRSSLQLSSRRLSSPHLLTYQQHRHCTKVQPHASHTLAMINVDGSPPLFLGAGMIAAGAVLYQLRNSKPYITKDFDIVLSCIAIFAGGILVFQGWRLDPILLFGQLLTAGAALSFAVEALRLRDVVHKKELSEAAEYERQAMDPRYEAPTPEALSLPARWDESNQMQADSQSLRPWWEEEQPAYRNSGQNQSTGAVGSSMQGSMDSQIPPDSAARQRNMASSNAVRTQQPRQGQFQAQQQSRSSEQGAVPQWSKGKQKWGSDIDLDTLEDWDSD